MIYSRPHRARQIGVLTLLFVLFFFLVPGVLAESPDKKCTDPFKNSADKGANDPGSSPLLNTLFLSSDQGGVMGGVSDACIQCGACELCDFLNIANQLARMIFGVFGAVALAMFIYGGVQFIVSSGNADVVGKAKSTLVNAVIGMFLIAFAWQIVHVVLIVLGTPEEKDKPGVQLIFGKPWDNPCGTQVKEATTPDQNKPPSN